MVYLALQPQPGLRQGLYARGQIELQRADALVVPVSAVRVDQARPYVLAVEAGRVVQRTVELGLRGEAVIDGGNVSAVALISGINEGTTLLRGTAGNVRDGMPVRLVAAVLPASAAASRPTNATAAR